MPIVKKDADREAVSAAAEALTAAAAAAGLRMHLDADRERTPGWKFNHWEMKARPARPLQTPAGACLGSGPRMPSVRAWSEWRWWALVTCLGHAAARRQPQSRVKARLNRIAA